MQSVASKTLERSWVVLFGTVFVVVLGALRVDGYISTTRSVDGYRSTPLPRNPRQPRPAKGIARPATLRADPGFFWGRFHSRGMNRWECTLIASSWTVTDSPGSRTTSQVNARIPPFQQS